MKSTLIVLVGAALALIPSGAVAQTQVVFGTPSNQVVPFPFFIPSSGFFNGDFPFPGFYHYFPLGDDVFNPEFEYTISSDVQYEFPVAGNFQYE